MIDIVMSTYNGELFLEQQIDSILNQSYTNWTLLIRDDGSKDNTLKILNRYKRLYPNKIKIVSWNGIRMGSTNSFFEILKLSKSELITFCDQDDFWEKNKLQLLYGFYQEKITNKNIPVLIHTDLEVVDSFLSNMPRLTIRFNKKKHGMGKTILWQIFQNDVTGCTVMINNKMRDEIKRIDFSKEMIIQHDWLLAQIAYLNNSKYYLSNKTVKYRQHTANVVGAKKRTLINRIRYKMNNGFSYKYYHQVGALLKTNTMKNSEYRDILTDFYFLRNQPKLQRVFWHIRNNFFRDGTIIHKIYQLIIC